MWLSRDNIVNTFSIRGPCTVECTRRASLGDGEECVDEGKLVVTRKQKVKCTLVYCIISLSVMQGYFKKNHRTHLTF